MSEDIDLTQNKINPKKLFYVLSIGWSLLVLAGTLPQVLEDFSNWKHSDYMSHSRSTTLLQVTEWAACVQSNPISLDESQKLNACLKGEDYLGASEELCRNAVGGPCRYAVLGEPYNDETRAFKAELSKKHAIYSSPLNKTLRWLSYTHYSGLFWVMILLLISGPLAFAFGPRAWFYFKSWMMDK